MGSGISKPLWPFTIGMDSEDIFKYIENEGSVERFLLISSRGL